MKQLAGKVAWVTGAGSGIGEAAALALATAGAAIVLSGRRKSMLDAVAAKIKTSGGTAMVKAGDLTRSSTVMRIASAIEAAFGRIDILVNNAGVNIAKRSWGDLDSAGVDELINCNLSGGFYCVLAVLPIMRRQKDGVLIHTAALAARFISPHTNILAGPAYIAAKHGKIAMSHCINTEECVNGIRSTVICPGEVATPILDKRPTPVSKNDRDLMMQSEDLGDLVLYVATRPAHVCMNEVVITPTWNRGNIAALNQRAGAR